jgi:hypothetical protein
MFPNFVTNHNSFDDSVAILKQKGMLNEGDAVKGTPDKAPTYDYPTQPGKYKKVVQEPEVDEQDGIYPATTLTDIPKEEVSKPVKSKTRPDGLEDIKNNDTKNEMKKVKVVKENLHNLKENPMKTTQLPPDTASLLSILKRIEAQTKAKFFAINNADELRDVFDYILDRVNPTLASSLTQLRTALNQAFDSNVDAKKAGKQTETSPSTNIKDKLKPAITKLVQEVLDEMGQE